MNHLELKQRFPDPSTLPSTTLGESKDVKQRVPKAPSVTSNDEAETMSYLSMEVHATASSKGEPDYEDSLDHIDEDAE